MSNLDKIHKFVEGETKQFFEIFDECGVRMKINATYEGFGNLRQSLIITRYIIHHSISLCIN